jgi:uncharacterized protein (DUF1684 family)
MSPFCTFCDFLKADIPRIDAKKEKKEGVSVGSPLPLPTTYSGSHCRIRVVVAPHRQSANTRLATSQTPSTHT